MKSRAICYLKYFALAISRSLSLLALPVWATSSANRPPLDIISHPQLFMILITIIILLDRSTYLSQSNS